MWVEMNELGVAVCERAGIAIAVLLVLSLLFSIYRKCRLSCLRSPKGKALLSTSDSDPRWILKQYPVMKSWVGCALIYSWVLMFIVGYICVTLLCWLSFAPHFYAPAFALEAFGGWHGLAAPWLVIFTADHIIAFVLVVTWHRIAGWFMIPVRSMFYATHVLIRQEPIPNGKSHRVWSNPAATIKRQMHQLQSKFLGAVTVVPILTDSSGSRYIEYMCARHVFDDKEGCFFPMGNRVFTTLQVHNQFQKGGLTTWQVESTRATCGPNVINVPSPGILASLVNEFANFAYVFNSFGAWPYLLYGSWIIGSLWVLLTLFVGVFRSLFIVRPNQQKVQKLAELADQCQVLRNGVWKKIKASEIVVGDVFAAEVHSALPCDGIVIDGSVVVNEAMLTGEPMPVSKFPPEYMKVDKRNLAFAGTECLTSTGPHTGSAVMLATAIGAVTKRGELVRMVLFPTGVKFKYADQMPLVYGILFVYWILLSMLYLSPLVYLFTWVDTYAMVLNSLVISCSPMILICQVLGQSVTASRLQNTHKISCLQPERIPIAGKISKMVFDKTGTITKDSVDFESVVSVEPGPRFGRRTPLLVEIQGSARSHNLTQVPTKLRHAMASCHTVAVLPNGTLVGNPVEVSMVQTLGVTVKGNFVYSHDGADALEVVKKFGFDHDRMTSGVVVRSPRSGEVDVYIKGSFEQIHSICSPAEVPADYDERAARYAKDGYYVLAVAFKSLPAGLSPKSIAALTRDFAESKLTVCGLLLFRNEMKPDSPMAISCLRQGSIHSVMCTGDNALSGLFIGRRCSIVSREASVLLGDVGTDGRLQWRDPTSDDRALLDPLKFPGCQLAVTRRAWRHLHEKESYMLEKLWMRVVVFARMQPEDKVDVVTYFQSRGLVVGMCGDGANDCGALRAAHAGLALSAMEASMISPFSTCRDGYSILTVVDLVREGRACLTTNLATFQYFVVQGFTMTSIRTFLTVYASLNFGEYFWMTMDLLFGIVMTWTMTLSKPTALLCNHRPTATLLGIRNLSAIAFPYLTALIAFGACEGLLWRQDWYHKFNPITEIHAPASMWMLRGDNYDSGIGTLVLMTALANTAYVNTYGGQVRQNILLNSGINVLYVAVIFAVGFLLLAPPTVFHCIYRVGCDSEHAYVAGQMPVLAFFAADVANGCFLGPQVKVWQDQLSQHGWSPAAPSHGGQSSQYWLPDPASRCMPPQGYGAAALDDPAISEHGCSGPNNCYPWDLKCQLLAVLVAYALVNHLFTKMVLQGVVAKKMRARYRTVALGQALNSAEQVEIELGQLSTEP